MEVVKEYLLAKYFSSFGYVVAVFHLPALVTLLALTLHFRTSERRRFSCPSSPDSRDHCLHKYDEQYNSPLQLYGFVLVCFVSLLAVCIAYSWCFVKSRVDELETTLKADPENPRPRPRVTTRRVFRAYFIHLLARFVLGILFVVLQNFLFYPSGFPSKFVCVTPTVKPTLRSTNVSNATEDHSSAINCHNSVAADNAVCAMVTYAVNILFVFLVFGEICYLLVQATRSKEFTFDSKFVQKHFFNKHDTLVTQGEALRRQRQICEETEMYEPLIAQFQAETEEERLLDDIFVDLVIYTGRAKHEFADVLDRHEIFDVYMKPQVDSIAIKKVEELFLPNEDTQDPNKILVVGRPGIGKSLLCTKLSRDWSKGDLLRDNEESFRHLFLFQFRWFNTETLEKISLKQLLSRLYSEGSIDREVFQDILDNPEKVLLVFDGLDEFKYHESCLEDERAHAGNSATEQMPFSALYVKLVRGKQLSGATVLTTCRPNVVQSVAHLKFDRKVEIMGFTPDKVKEYVQKFCAHDPESVNKIWNHISSNLQLQSLCYIPVNSRIVCSLLAKLIKLTEHDSGSTLPATSTEVYEGALRLFIFNHHPEFKGKLLTKEYLVGNVGFSETVENTLSQVGKLAKTGIEERRLMFDSTEVQGMENCGLLNRIPDCEVSPFRLKCQFCFIHLTLQEFLAAREIVKMDPSELSAFIYSNASDPKWQLVIQFVAGLLHGQENEAVNTFVSILCNSLTKGGPKQEALLMIKCLHEYHNEATVEKAASQLQKNNKFCGSINFTKCQVTPVDCIALSYFIRHLHKPSQLTLRRSNVTDQGVSQLSDALKYEHCKLTELDLCRNNITDQGISHLCDALKNEHCNLTGLDLRGNNITDQGVSHLCDALKDEHCKLAELNLRHTNITDQGVSHLCDALKDEHCKLADLNLRHTNVTDQGVSHLCVALKDEHCNLADLNLRHTDITDQGVSHLCDALKDEHCKVAELNLRYTNITDQGVSHLCDALKNEHCKLTVLDLCGNNITNQGVSHLCDALKDKHCKLTGLDLRCHKNIKERGESHLCYALKDGHCRLTGLYLGGISIADQGVSHLCDALKDEHCKITGLDLHGITITEQGVSHLCDALKDGHCKLTWLDLGAHTGITEQGVSHLCDALKDEHCKLTGLNLGNNKITDQGVSLLCDELKDEHCKLTELDLRGNNITDQGVSQLCDALKYGHCELTGLDLGGNIITDQGVSHLCHAMKNGHCKLTGLYLGGNNITDQGVSHLCDIALKNEHCKLIGLDLRGNNITDQGVSHLCDALKDGHCKLTELYLDSNNITEQGVSHLCDALKDGHCKLIGLDLGVTR